MKGKKKKGRHASALPGSYSGSDPLWGTTSGQVRAAEPIPHACRSHSGGAVGLARHLVPGCTLICWLPFMAIRLDYSS